ncbi:MAG TPA: hypothetical protein VGC65_11235 [Bacteroidia bacterium]
MKKPNLLLTLLFALTITVTTSCRKKGCTNRDADNYEENAKKDDGSCMCRYASAVRIDAIPATNGSGSSWDFGAPDLYVRFSKSSSPTWDYVTNIASDAATPASLILPSGDIKFTNENWQFQIVDYDTPDPDDIIFSGTFNPLSNGGSGNIVVTGTGVSLTFIYTTK